MADESPGKVQALRAIFTEKNSPVMGMLPLNQKVPYRPWKPQTETADVITNLKEKTVNEQTMTKVLPFPAKPSCEEDSDRPVGKKLFKPTVGPKPVSLLHPAKTNSSTNHPTDTGGVRTADDPIQNPTSADSHGMQLSGNKSKGFGETIASFMFNSELSNKENDESVNPTSASKLRTRLEKNVLNKLELVNLCSSQSQEALAKHDFEASCRNIISSDNYVCKSSGNFRRRELPPIEKLGSAPLKPTKPQHLRLPAKLCASQVCNSHNKVDISQPPQIPAPILTLDRPPVPQRPSYPCPPRPLTSPPLPPVTTAPVIKPPSDTLQEIEELYEDTLSEERRRPASLIPEYTAEEEEFEELYNDAGELEENVSPFSASSPVKPKIPPPPCPSEYLQPNIHGSNEELYQDAEEAGQEEFYEEMPCDTIIEEFETPLYSNNRKELEKLRREEEKRVRKEQKEREKREKEMEKLKKKFGLTGDEVPIDDGLVKADSRGGKGDLPVKRGETVLILRMEGNPSGKWLVKNEKGKIGYVELTNIEVDPLSVKSVMATGRLSMISYSEELYSEAKSEEEAIYEVTY